MKSIYTETIDRWPVSITEDNNAITRLGFGRADFLQKDYPLRGAKCCKTPLIEETIKQLKEYFAGKRMLFDLPLRIESGTPFQMTVWTTLKKIPYGQTKSYGDIAKEIGNPGAARAVGGACHNNPIAIVIPCHRVLGSNGELIGYGSGLGIKEALLTLERSCAKKNNDS